MIEVEHKFRKFKIGLALSGGGIKGLCHVGVLKALDEYGIKPDIISGVSAGAIIGALYADGYKPDEIVDFFDDVSFRQMTKIKFPEGGFFSIENFENFLDGKLRAKSFGELKIPLRVVATNLDKGQSVTFTSGNLLKPIVASCSVPVLFMPQQIDGANYVDGGVINNFPVSVIRKDCEKVIGVNASPLVADDYKLSIINVATRAYHFMYKANIKYDKEMCDLLIEPTDISNYEMFDTKKSKEIYNLGYSNTIKLLEDFIPEMKIV